MNIPQMKLRYESNKSAKTGSLCVCPSCNTSFTKLSYQQVFCKSKPLTQCKDKYWNTVDPNKRNNTTRISPASQAFLEKKANRLGFPDHKTRKEYVDDFDGSWDAHGCHVANCEYCGMKPEFCQCD